MKSLSLFREEAYEENAGHQPVTSHLMEPIKKRIRQVTQEKSECNNAR